MSRKQCIVCLIVHPATLKLPPPSSSSLVLNRFSTTFPLFPLLFSSAAASLFIVSLLRKNFFDGSKCKELSSVGCCGGGEETLCRVGGSSGEYGS
jgi:hypothetical protein